MPPDTLSRGFRARWAAGRCHLTRFRGDSVPGGRQGDATWNAFAGIPCQVEGRKGHLEHFAGIPCQVDSRERTPGTLSRGFRARWTAGSDTWNTFAEFPWQVDSRERTPGTLSREFRSRWVTYRQGHTVALRRSFPQCGPLPFSGADASFGLCMSLPSRKILAPDVLT